MKVLLDTHAFVWFINGDDQLTSTNVDLIKDLENECYLSIASLWEIAIKHSLNRLALDGGFDRIQEFLVANEIELLPISFVHTQQLLRLEYHHRDPFDRMIISQSLSEQIPVLTKDEHFKQYPLTVIW